MPYNSEITFGLQFLENITNKSIQRKKKILDHCHPLDVLLTAKVNQNTASIPCNCSPLSHS